MALGTAAKIFEKDRVVWFAEFIKSEGEYKPTLGCVSYILKGRIIVSTFDGNTHDFSPIDRKLCLTREECNEICKLMNNALTS